MTRLSNRFDIIFRFEQNEWFDRCHYFVYLGLLNIISILAYFVAAGILIVRFAKKNISKATPDEKINDVTEQEMLVK